MVEDLAGNLVDLVGSGHTGNMTDNSNEGRPEERINQTLTLSAPALTQRPNVILLNVGSNDVVCNDDLAGAPSRLTGLLDRLVDACPDALILVSKLGPSPNTLYQERMDTFNEALTNVTEQFVSQGKHMLLVDTTANLNITTDLYDDLHPNDLGYRKMATAWVSALSRADSMDWIAEPTPLPKQLLTAVKSQCPRNPLWLPLPLLFPGFETTSISFSPIFADLNGDSRADYIFTSSHGLLPFLNLPNPFPNPAAPISWSRQSTVPVPRFTFGSDDESITNNVFTADLTASGQADLLFLHPNQSISACFNSPPTSPSSAPTFLPPSLIAPPMISDHEGIRFADLDGDGRADYVYISPNGSLNAWLNRPNSESPSSPQSISWLPIGQIANGGSETNREDVHLVDLDGDGRADYLVVSPMDGAVYAFYNRGPGKAQRAQNERRDKNIDHNTRQGPETLTVVTENAIGRAKGGLSKGWTWAQETRKQAKRIMWTWTWTSWSFGSKGASNVPMVENDMNKEPYRWGEVDPASSANRFSAAGSSSDSTNGNDGDDDPPWIWEDRGLVASGIGIGGGEVVFADLDGDGRAEYLWIEDETGAVYGWGNGCEGLAGGRWE